MLLKKSIIFILITLIIIVFSFVGMTANAQNLTDITIGYFPNITHAPAIIGIEKNIFEKHLKNLNIKTRTFPNGSLFMNALSTNRIDIGYVGPGPSINRFLQGAQVTALASASTGGTVLVTNKNLELNSATDLKNKLVATPALGCTHDLLFRKYIKNHDLKTEKNNGEIGHRAQKPATMIGLFATNQLDAAMVSEPWAARMKKQLDANIAINWDQVPWEGKLPATVLVSRNNFITNNQEIIKSFLKAHLEAIEYIKNNPEESAKIIKNKIADLTRQELSLEVISNSMKRTNMTANIESQIVQELADLSSELGFIKGDSNLEGFINTTYLEGVYNEKSQ